MGATRSEREDLLNRLQESCFICAIPKIEFINNDEDFDQHISGVHSPIAYLSYLIDLEASEKRDYTGIQTIVKRAFDRDGEISFLPLHSSLSLNNKKEQHRLTDIANKAERMKVSLGN